MLADQIISCIETSSYIRTHMCKALDWKRGAKQIKNHSSGPPSPPQVSRSALEKEYVSDRMGRSEYSPLETIDR